MKKVVRSIAVVALMLATATGIAKEPKLNLTPNTEKSLTFELDTQLEETLIKIVDVDGNVIYFEDIDGVKMYTKKFDLKKLPVGNYFLKVENDLKETIYTIALDNSAVKIMEKKENSKPVFRKDGGRVFLNLLNLDKDDVKITIFDSEHRIVFEETISETMIVEKTFNFEKAYDDTYMVVVRNGKDTFYENVLVK